MLKEWWDRIARVDASSDEGRVIYLVMIMSVTSILSIVLALLFMSWAPLYALGLGWLFVAVYAIMQGSALSSASRGIGSITAPSGQSTPSVNQHSNISTMVIRGRFAEAAVAYKEAIAADPLDTVACEQLAQLALRDMKDYPTAVWAYREAEKRTLESKRKLGYAILIAGIYRDSIKDTGKAMGEIRRILSQYPQAPNAARLRAELEELKAIHFEGS